MKAVTTVRLDDELKELARMRSINLGQLLERALKKELKNEICSACGRPKHEVK